MPLDFINERFRMTLADPSKFELVIKKLQAIKCYKISPKSLACGMIMISVLIMGIQLTKASIDREIYSSTLLVSLLIL